MIHVHITDNELHTSASCVKNNIQVLASGLDVTVADLQQMKDTYGETTSTLAYRILRSYCDTHPNVTKKDLGDRLHALGFRSAAQK